MELGYISTQELPVFRTLLLPNVVEAMERGEPVTAIGLIEDGIACGAAAGYPQSGRFQIVSFYVTPDYQRRGGGRMMMDYLLSLVTGFPGVSGLEISFTKTNPAHDALEPFLTEMGFVLSGGKDENIYLTSLGQVAQSLFFAVKTPPSPQLLPFSQIPRLLLASIDKELRHKGAPLPQLPLTSPELEREVSCALIKNNEIQSFLAVEHSSKGELILSFAWAGTAGPIGMPPLLRRAFHTASSLYPPETPVIMQAINIKSARLLQVLLPDAVPISFTYYRPLDTDFA